MSDKRPHALIQHDLRVSCDDEAAPFPNGSLYHEDLKVTRDERDPQMHKLSFVVNARRFTISVRADHLRWALALDG